MNMRAALLIVIPALLLGSCKSDPGSPGGTLVGNLHGRLMLYDQCGDTVADRSGVTVAIEGTRYSTRTGADGTWTIKDLPTGTYVVSITKDDFSTDKYFGYQFVGGGEAYFGSYYLYQLPAWTITNLAARIDTVENGSGTSFVILSASLAGCSDVHYYPRFYLSDRSTVSPTDYKAFKDFEGRNSGLPQAWITSNELHDFGFAKGTTVYMVAYPDNGSRYYDPITGKDVRTGYDPSNHSNAISFVAP
jgi:hypothetical protein